MKKLLLPMTLFFSIALPAVAMADSAPGDMIITLGENLTDAQKKQVLEDIGAGDNAQIITVSNEEEHKYLGDYIPKAQIGTKAISSSSITIGDKGSGIQVKTKNINWVTDEMYLNALITAGVKDADIYVTAPFSVSGTAGLTGLIKAYEVSSDKEIPEEVKQVANEEMVETAKLGDSVGAEKATALIATIKKEIAEKTPKNDEELRSIIENAAKEVGVTLSDQEMNSLIDLFNKMKELDINWDQVGDQLNQAKEKLTNYLESEEGQNFLERLKRFFVSVIDAIKAFFS